MTKQALAAAELSIEQAEKRLNDTTNYAVKMIEQAMSVLANQNPSVALHVISEMQKQIPQIEEVTAHNEEAIAKKVAAMADMLPDVIELEDE